MPSNNCLIVAGLVVAAIGLIIASAITKNVWPAVIGLIFVGLAGLVGFIESKNRQKRVNFNDEGPSVVQYEDVIDATSASGGGGEIKLHYTKGERGNGDPRYMSDELNEKKESLVTIDLPPGKDTTKLGFVRSTKEYTLPMLIAEFINWCKENTPTNSIELQDDASFTVDNCTYSAVMYRLLTQTGEISIYNKFGFQPVLPYVVCKIRPGTYTEDMYDNDVKLIRSAPATIWEKISNYCLQLKRAPTQLEKPTADQSLRTMLLSLLKDQCDKMTGAFRDIDFATNRAVNGVLKVDDPIFLEFLISFYRVKTAQYNMKLM